MKHLALAGLFIAVASAAAACTIEIPDVRSTSSAGSSASGEAGGSTSSGTSSSASAGASGSTSSGVGGGAPGCTSMVLATSDAPLTAMAVDGTDVYYASETAGKIWRVPKDGSKDFETFIQGVSPLDIVVDDHHVYYLNVEASSVGRADKQTRMKDDAFSSDAGPVARITQDSSHVYWTTSNPCQVRRVDKSGGAIAVLTTMPVGDTPCGDVVAESDKIFWTSMEQVHQVDKSGGGQMDIAINQPPVFGLAAIPGVVYFTTGQAIRITDAGVEGGQAHPFPHPFASPAALVDDDDGAGLYFGDRVDGGTGIEKISYDGQSWTSVFTLPGDGGVAVRIVPSGECLYVMDSNSVRRVPKHPK